MLLLSESSLKANVVFSFSGGLLMKVLPALVFARQRQAGCGESRAVCWKVIPSTLQDGVTSVCLHLHSQLQRIGQAIQASKLMTCP